MAIKIKSLVAREILDSRGDPTVETRVILDNGLSAKASVPSGASTGEHEAKELRDNDPKRYGGKGVLGAVSNVNQKIARSLIGANIAGLKDIDQKMIELDGTADKSRLGANAILSVSLVCARAAALAEERELYEFLAGYYEFPQPKKMPCPSFNIFNGGKHADTNLDFQEFTIMPVVLGKKKRPARLFAEQVRAGAEIFHELGRVLKEADFDTDVGNEGGYAPDIVSSIQAIELILAAIIRAGYKPGAEIGLGIDVGSAHLYDPSEKKYVFKLDHAHFTASALEDLYNDWLRRFPIISIEDGLGEDDWSGWQSLTKRLRDEILLIGDDLFVTNEQRLRRGIKEKAANAILIKPNQVGTVSETMACVKLAQKHRYKIMVSHRSGETVDDFIADLAVAIGAEYIKSGSLSRGERLAKYNRLMEIEDNLSGRNL